MDQYLFSGLKVIDCATVIAAPAAAMMLADYGADVIKIEPPGGGDMLRMLSEIPTTPDAGPDWLWQLDGRNKRSIALDLKAESGMAVLRRLVREADVFITNQPHPVRRSLGLSYEDLKSLNPALIYASLTAYGEQGPERDRKGFDQLAYWARSGLMDLMREPDTMPTQGLPGMGDHPTGVALYAGIVTALLQRERTGEGGLVSTSLLANGLWSAAGIAQGALAGADMDVYRERNRTYPAMLRPYQAADGRWLQLNMIRDDAMRAQALAVMDAAQLQEDPRFATPEAAYDNREALGEAIQASIGSRPSADWLARFAAAGIPVNRVAVIEETVNDPQIEQNAMACESEQGYPIINPPMDISSVPRVGPKPAPALNAHALEILEALGYSAAEIAELRRQGVP